MDRVDVITCPSCTNTVPRWFFQQSKNICPTCYTDLTIEVFPAFFRKTAPGKTGETLLVDDESSCFYHPGKRAIILCGNCGRFLCDLCDVEFGDRHICPSCLEHGKTKKKIKDLEHHRVMYDYTAMMLALVSLLLIWPSIVAAPVALYIAIRYWNAPLSIIPRTKIRFVVAIIVSVFELAGWVAVIYFLILHITGGI